MMLTRPPHLILMVFVALTCCVASQADVTPLSQQQAQDWQRWLIPLPKQIEFSGQVKLAPSGVGISLSNDAGDVERTAAAELSSLFDERAGVEPNGDEFTIVLGVCDREGKVQGRQAVEPGQLRALPNSDQAYTIAPNGDDELVLTALSDRGVYHAAQTLRQLLQATLTEDEVTIPMIEVLDWPDLAERGEWGGSCVRDIEWLAGYKMNHVEMHVRHNVNEDGTTTVDADEEAIDRGRRRAMNIVPIITHLEHLRRTGLYDVYPELAGEGYDIETARRGLIPPCASNPRFIDILAGWMDGMASLEGVSDICAWLSESHVQCKCEECQKHGQFVLETRALVDAWRRAQTKHPDLGLRILLTQGSYSSNAEVLEEVPPEVGVTYYHGGKTYDSSRDPMIYPLLAEYAADGNWLGCYPQLTASWRIVCPWTGPQFIRFRMNEFVDKGLECLVGYATPDNRCYEFNVIAAAEWSWNAKGRSPRDFATAWATRKGFQDPDAVAEWAVRMGPVGWDLYGSRVPYSAFFGGAANIVKQRKAPKLGEGMYRYFPTLDKLDDDIATCDWAAATAADFDAPALVAEANVIGGMLGMLRGIYNIATILEQESQQEAARKRLNAQMHQLAIQSRRATNGLRNWRDALEGWNGASRFDDTIQVTGKTASDIGDFLGQFGITDPGKPYRMNDIGEWTADDFEESARTHKLFEVTDLVRSGGTYKVGFRYTTGWHGLHSYGVELLTGAGEDPEQMQQVAADVHEGVAAYSSRDNIYTLQVDEVDRDARYFIRVDIRGVPDSTQPPEHKGCGGTVWMRKAGSLEPDSNPPQLEPMTDEGASLFGPPRFRTNGLHVGVLTAGYGSASIHQWLAAQDGVEAVPLARPEADMIAPCEVVVIPQPRTASRLGDSEVGDLRAFVRDGGGLVVTHDAAGFRGQPVIVAEVCAGGSGKTRQTEWIAVGDHPVTVGIESGSRHGQSYYDQIELTPGPDGEVIARSAEDKGPIALAGHFGNGRYVAIGLAVGLASDDSEVEPKGAEARLMLNAVRWAGG